MSNDRTGRATYKPALRLNDVVSNTLSDFATHFSFIVDSNGQQPYADGFAFFIATVDFPMPETQDGNGLGLVGGVFKFNTSASLTFVAVKDLESDHVGIDVGTMESVTGVKWNSGVLDGRMGEA